MTIFSTSAAISPVSPHQRDTIGDQVASQQRIVSAVPSELNPRRAGAVAPHPFVGSWLRGLAA